MIKQSKWTLMNNYSNLLLQAQRVKKAIIFLINPLQSKTSFAYPEVSCMIQDKSSRIYKTKKEIGIAASSTQAVDPWTFTNMEGSSK
jgi:hypothetical protein